MAGNERGPEGYDVIVVGAGSAGCVVAARLSEDADRSVLLLEAGGWDERPEIGAVTAAEMLALVASDWSPTIDWGYVTEPEPGLGGRTVPIARGRVMGGCSSVNALMWVRGHPLDYDGWAAAGAKGWSWPDVAPAFVRAECWSGPTDGERGRSGPIAVSTAPERSEAAEAFLHAAAEAGYPAAPDADYNGARQVGFAFPYQITRTPEGHRSSAAAGYLHSAAGRTNLTVRVSAQVHRIVIRDGRATGVEYVQDGARHVATADHEVIVCAGAFESPKLLMLSGIGPAAELRRFGLAVEQDLPGVGANLQDHLFVPVCFAARRPLSTSTPLSEVGLFTHVTGHPDAPPDLQFTFGPLAVLPTEPPVEGSAFTVAAVGLRPESRGTVVLRSADPTLPAVVRAGYLSAQADVDVLVHGVELGRELVRGTAFDGLRGGELGASTGVAGTAMLRDHVRRAATTLWHPIGTCRMGTDDTAVVDPHLHVHGISGLRVADASVMPRIVAGNTNAASIMIGERLAELIASG